MFDLLIDPLQRALARSQYTTPTPIQSQSIAPILDGRDILGTAQTGTGKTAAFTLPILQHLTLDERKLERGRPRTLVVAPTRELAAQIGESIETYGRYLRVEHTVIFGGVTQGRQVSALERGVDIVVATPGRLLDLMNQGHLSLDGVEWLVLDEVDRMLDMGFIHDIRRILAQVPEEKQSLFFSATMAPEVEKLARQLVRDPVQVAIEPEKPAVERIEQKVLFVEKKEKQALLTSLMDDNRLFKIIVFTRLKHTANRVATALRKAGVPGEAIHGNKSQGARTRALGGFKSDRLRVLVATDIAARGIDVDGVTHVINYDLPNEPETYVHRIGRTARAGAEGDAISFCSTDEVEYLRDIEKLLRRNIPIDTEHEFHSRRAEETARNWTRGGARQGKSNPKSGSRSGGSRGSRPRREGRPDERGGRDGRPRRPRDDERTRGPRERDRFGGRGDDRPRSPSSRDRGRQGDGGSSRRSDDGTSRRPRSRRPRRRSE